MSAITYRVVRSSRRTIAIHILPEGTVEVRCPRSMSAAQVDAFVKSKTRWIEKQLQRLPAQTEKMSAWELKALKAQASAHIPGRVAYYAQLVGVSYDRITIRHQKTRWGSCSGKGNLNFNCLLMLTPPEILDYVVVHELCHRKEMNHSPRFWAEVSRVLPGYEACRRWLKDHGRELTAKLP